MNDFSMIVVSVLLGVLVVAGIKAIIMDIKDLFVSARVKKMLKNNPELEIKIFELTQKMKEIVNGEE
jgi:hypothetical protein